MAKSSPGITGESLLGLSRTANRPPNTNSWLGSIAIIIVLVLAAIYAAPNLFQPDPALQIRAASDGVHLDDATMQKALDTLQRAGIQVTGHNHDATTGLIRVASDEQQLRGRDLIAGVLNPTSDRRFVVALNRAPTTPHWLRDIGGEPLNLGLDLSGGVHFLLEVDMDKFLSDRMKANVEGIRNLLVDKRLRYIGTDWLEGRTLRIPFQSAGIRDQARKAIAGEFSDFTITDQDVDGHPGLVLAISDDKIKELEDFAISQNLTSLRNRVNELGVSEPLVQRLGRTRIVLDLPGIQDSARAKEIINKFANLEFRLVAGTSARPGQTETYQYENRPVVLDKTNIVTGDQVTNAVQDFDPKTGQPQVSITLNSQGGQRMNEVTQHNVGNRMAIIFKELKVHTRTVMQDGKPKAVPYTVEDKRVINVATIQSALGYRFRITGLQLGEARDLALLLRAGALAAPMYIVQESTVGASLGDENIHQGMNSVIIGFALVLAFMIVYYKWFGVAANLALGANVILMVAVMSALHATLTLPGIAGIVLTVGMAVDANVLIFSRIREELDRNPPQAAIQAGFERALVTILDANITTFLIAIILFFIGSGPVKGFAVTLSVGLVTSMFTAIVVCRAVINLMYGGRKLDRLAI